MVQSRAMQASMSGSLGGGRIQTFAQIRPFEKSLTVNNNAMHHNVCHNYEIFTMTREREFA